MWNLGITTFLFAFPSDHAAPDTFLLLLWCHLMQELECRGITTLLSFTDTLSAFIMVWTFMTGTSFPQDMQLHNKTQNTYSVTENMPVN
jgi:hypothetical protein